MERLALGGMAELFLAEEEGREGRLVIKRILPYLSDETDFVRMFLDEARIASQLHHRSIIQLFELGRLEESLFISMELVEGVDLRKLLSEETKLGLAMPYGVAAYVVARLCSALHYAHNAKGVDGRPLGVIHRDVSPQNVMVSYDGQVKLVDFGISKATALVERSKPGVIKGKFLYLAPEQLTQERIDHRADLFALGSMLYELTTGRAPFHKPTTEAVIYAIRNDEVVAPGEVRSGYPAELSRIVMRCLEKDRDQRYQQAGEIRKDLEAFLASSHPTDAEVLSHYIQRLLGEEERTDIHALEEPSKKPAPLRSPERNSSERPARGEASAKGPDADEAPAPELLAEAGWGEELPTVAVPGAIARPPARKRGANAYRRFGPEHPDVELTDGGERPMPSLEDAARDGEDDRETSSPPALSAPPRRTSRKVQVTTPGKPAFELQGRLESRLAELGIEDAAPASGPVDELFDDGASSAPGDREHAEDEADDEGFRVDDERDALLRDEDDRQAVEELQRTGEGQQLHDDELDGTDGVSGTHPGLSLSPAERRALGGAGPDGPDGAAYGDDLQRLPGRGERSDDVAEAHDEDDEETAAEVAPTVPSRVPPRRRPGRAGPPPVLSPVALEDEDEDEGGEGSWIVGAIAFAVVLLIGLIALWMYL